MTIKIGFSGVPGSGKTTSTRLVSGEIRKHTDFKIETVSEYARRYIAKYGVPTHSATQLRLTQKQVEWENTAASKADITITDSPVFLGWFYMLQCEPKDIHEFVIQDDFYKELRKLNFPEKRYDIIFHLSTAIKPQNDGVRIVEHLDDKWRDESNVYLNFIFKKVFPPKKFIEVPPFTDRNQIVDYCVKEILNVCKAINAERSNSIDNE